MSSQRGIGLARSHLQNALPKRICQFTSIKPAVRSYTTLRPRDTRLSYRRQFIPTCVNSRRLYATETGDARKTPLYDFHVQKGGKMVEFGGYLMPVQYSDLSIKESHIWTREKASIFDVSHMLQHELTGPGASNFLSLITPSSPKSLAPFTSTLSTLLHPTTGGIVDDTIITHLSSGWKDRYYFVTNAGCRDKDIEYLTTQLKAWRSEGNAEIQWKMWDKNGLIALQGPLAAAILQALKPTVDGGKHFDLETLKFGQCKYLVLPSVEEHCLVSRGGYTGEDGFEISIPHYGMLNYNNTLALTEALLKVAGEDKLRMAGLGARDSLRLEAGMCLYGHDIDDTTTPVEAGLSWIIPKDRRNNGGFHGAETILSQLKTKKEGGTGVSRRRVGLVINDKAAAREGAKIVDGEGNEIGVVTSGCPSPTLGTNIAMGYVRSGSHKAGTEVGVLVRGKVRKATVSKMPFVPSKYYK
ncbi:glycine cleavage system T protein [Tothia fuscella]|uniref:Aminomethyltransferase n=1 Tax=Tothia fuscella TaxID=1048955 RepID=A0A9P4NNR0_9PEZI|nr:glycine cleavage system T protein [Tothia fuscella]